MGGRFGVAWRAEPRKMAMFHAAFHASFYTRRSSATPSERSVCRLAELAPPFDSVNPAKLSMIATTRLVRAGLTPTRETPHTGGQVLPARSPVQGRDQYSRVQRAFACCSRVALSAADPQSSFRLVAGVSDPSCSNTSVIVGRRYQTALLGEGGSASPKTMADAIAEGAIIRRQSRILLPTRWGQRVPPGKDRVEESPRHPSTLRAEDAVWDEALAMA